MKSENTLSLIAARITEAREALNLTQKQLAEKLGISRSTLCLYEAGANKPDALFMNRLAQIAPFSADYLLGLSDIKAQDANTRMICRQTGLSETAVQKLEQHQAASQPYLNKILEGDELYLLTATLVKLRDSYRKWSPELVKSQEKMAQEVKAQFGEGYELLSITDKLTMQEYDLTCEWQELLNVLKKEARLDGQKGE